MIEKNHSRYKHGMSNTRFYKAWEAMKARCNNKNVKKYHRYGGRGIKVCDEWNNDFLVFKKDMFSSFKEGLSLDRINNNGDYCKENCKWSNNIEQNKNRNNNVKYKGECASEASLRLGGGPNFVCNRLRKGWSKEKAFTQYVKKN